MSDIRLDDSINLFIKMKGEHGGIGAKHGRGGETASASAIIVCIVCLVIISADIFSSVIS